MVQVAQKRVAQIKHVAPSPISWERFQRRYLTREDRWKYEWVNGAVEKTEQTMDQTQSYLAENLIEFFFKFKLENKLEGNLFEEMDSFFAGNHRRPDLAYYSKKLVAEIRKGQLDLRPDFVIEVVSTNDQMLKVETKMSDYRRAEVAVVWVIFPKLQTVHVYRGKQMTVCTGDDICSAEPVLEGFLMPASEIFK